MGEQTVSKTATTQELESELQAVELGTRDDGRVKAEILDVEPTNNRSLEVEFCLPNGGTKTERMERPDRDVEEFKFVRLCRQNGASLGSFRDLLVGASVPVENQGGEWIIHAPDDPSVGDRITGAGSRVKGVLHSLFYEPNRTGGLDREDIVMMTVLAPLIGLMGMMEILAGDGDFRNDAVHVVIGMFIVGFWALGIGLFLTATGTV